MSSTSYFVCTFLLTHGAAMAFGARELWTLRRGDEGGWREDRVPEAPKPKPLPDCLIPKLGPRAPDWETERELELV
jgi:hypothetical protein